MINTRKVTDRRPLRLENLDSALREAESLAQAEREGVLRSTGNWSLGQAIGHVAFWAHAPSEGYPGIVAAPWFIRWLCRPLKSYFLNRGVPAGRQIPKVPGGTYGIELLATDDALVQFRAAFARLAQE